MDVDAQARYDYNGEDSGNVGGRGLPANVESWPVRKAKPEQDYLNLNTVVKDHFTIPLL